MKIAAIVQARMGSTRLPGKVLKTINDQPLLQILHRRLRKSKRLDEVIIATTANSKDAPIVEFCRREGIPWTCGSEDDVLARYHQAAEEHEVDVIARITSDCPIIDPAVVDAVITWYLDHRDDVDFVANTVPLPCLYPDGMDVEVFSRELLEQAHREAVLPSHREHVTFYMWQTGKFRCFRLDPPEDWAQYRLTVDYPADFEVISAIVRHFHPRLDFSLDEIIGFLQQHPELTALQEGIQRNAGWQRAFEADKKFLEGEHHD